MAQAGDCYEVVLKEAHLGWGTYRHTWSRDTIAGEGYIPIPHDFAVSHEILNSNGTGKQDILGKNVFRCSSEDGWFNGIIKAQGCNHAGDIYAKQFAEDDNLKGIGTWFSQAGAHVGSKVTVRWLSDISVSISIEN